MVFVICVVPEVSRINMEGKSSISASCWPGLSIFHVDKCGGVWLGGQAAVTDVQQVHTGMHSR